MSKAWATAHDVVAAAELQRQAGDLRCPQRQRHRTVCPQELRVRCRSVLVANPHWWGRRGNVDEADLCRSSSPTPRASPRSFRARSTSSSIRRFRTFARLQEEGRFKLAETTDIGTQYLGFDQSRDELQFSDVKGRNPFKDLRVRRAVYQAIDIDAIVAKVLRGQATPTGSYRLAADRRLPRPSSNSRLRYDPAAARRAAQGSRLPRRLRGDARLRQRRLPRRGVPGDRRHARAGRHPDDVPALADRDILPQADAGDDQLLRVRLVAAAPTRGRRSMRSCTATAATAPARSTAGATRIPSSIRLIDAIRVEPDIARRRQLVGDALRLMHADLPLIPLYRRTLTWVMRAGHQRRAMAERHPGAALRRDQRPATLGTWARTATLTIDAIRLPDDDPFRRRRAASSSPSTCGAGRRAAADRHRPRDRPAAAAGRIRRRRFAASTSPSIPRSGATR